MTSGRYLMRLDDACPTMRTETWRQLEMLFFELGIKPVIGVIPENKDPSLMISREDPQFWARMRHWQANGWEIVMHGLHHLYHIIPTGYQPIFPLSDKSEFVGLPLHNQKQMLAKGFSIMSEAGLRPRAFMAPSHTLDLHTIQALRESTDIRIITDGHALGPYIYKDFTWLPQQLWRFREMPFGIWCICLHPNTMSEAELNRLTFDLRRSNGRFIDADTAIRYARPISIFDQAFAGLYRGALRIKKAKHLFHA